MIDLFRSFRPLLSGTQYASGIAKEHLQGFISYSGVAHHAGRIALACM